MYKPRPSSGPDRELETCTEKRRAREFRASRKNEDRVSIFVALKNELDRIIPTIASNRAVYGS